MFIILPLSDMRDVGALGAPQRGPGEAHEDGRRDERVVGGVELRCDVRRVTRLFFSDVLIFHGNNFHV